jgi:cell wall-associated NlpC family hydrolase
METGFAVRRGALVLTASVLIPSGLAAGTAAAATNDYQYQRYLNPARTVVTDPAGRWLATFTDNARSVALTGPARRFAESTTTATVTSSTWVRLLASPFTGTVDTVWLSARLADTSPDILAISMQYIRGAPAITDGNGTVIAIDASYGPLQPDGTRDEGSDFNDFLGVSWTYGATVDAPEPDQFRSLDCSGFVRMVWGYRDGLPLSLSTDGGTSLPRRAFQMLDSAPGLVVIGNSGTQVTKFTRLQAGDLVFFDASTNDGAQVDHVGMYLGLDSAGHRRFISSRKTVDGPTLGDTGGKSLLDGTGLYASAFRATRRL